MRRSPIREQREGEGKASGTGKRAGIEVKRVDVPYPTSNSGVPSSASVSVSKAPWDDQDEEKP